MKAKYKEKLLVDRVQSRQDAEAFGELYDLYIEKIFRFIIIKVSNKEEAEDITSEVFLKTWNYLISGKSTQEIQSFSGLVYRIARNTLVDYYRSKAHKKEYPLDSIIEVYGEESKEFRHIDTAHEVSQILTVLKKMKREYQEVILLRYIEELSIVEISEILNKKKTNVRVTLHRAMKLLKKLLT